MEYPIFNSKALSDGKIYNLVDPVERSKYFHAKLGNKIDEVKEYLESGTFVGYMLAKKQAGKGTYAKMIEEILGPERFVHISVGDLIREAHEKLSSSADNTSLIENIKKYYRGFMSIEDAVTALLGRSQDKVSVPTELVLSLLKMEIEKHGRKGIFIDGLPRSMDQISYSLYFRELINFRDDPDFFILINTPDSILDARMKNRVICPVCHTSKSLLINPTKYVRYDKETHQYYYICDNSGCSGFGSARYVTKEGDSAGIESIRERLNADQSLMDMAQNLHGIPSILIRSTIPVGLASDYIEDYEVQECYKFNGEGDNIKTETVPWIIKDDKGVDSYTFYAATFVLNIFSQMHKILIG